MKICSQIFAVKFQNLTVIERSNETVKCAVLIPTYYETCVQYVLDGYNGKTASSSIIYLYK